MLLSAPSAPPPPSPHTHDLDHSPLRKVDQLFLFQSKLGANYVGSWSSNTSFTITIVDSTGHDISSSSRTFKLSCLRPIRDAQLRNLPSTCDSYGEIFVGDFGVLLSPTLVSAIAEDSDNTDGILSAGDTISMHWSRPTDRSVTGGGGCPTAPAAEHRTLTGEPLYSMVVLGTDSGLRLNQTGIEFTGALASLSRAQALAALRSSRPCVSLAESGCVMSR